MVNRSASKLLHLATRRIPACEQTLSTMIGKVGPFEGDDDEWDHYVERLSFYFTANKITDKGQQRAVLLSVC